MEYGLIGEHLGHSFSKEIHALLGIEHYELKELKPEEVEAFIKGRSFKGINVTIPYKQAVMPFLDEIDAHALKIGAVNTIVNENGHLKGYNTDHSGMVLLAEKNGIDMKDATVAILGSGGTSKTARAVAETLGAKRILRVSRHPKDEDEVNYETLYQLRDEIEVLINTTPVGMYHSGITGMAADPEKFKNLRGVLDAVFNPLCTELVLAAKKKGIAAVGGLYMLVAQAAVAEKWFFKDDSLEKKTEAVYQALLRQKKNIVLTGMPGSGKTTMGKLMAKEMRLPFVDTDEVFVESLGVDIPSYFAQNGEKAFRDEESRIIKELGERNGLIIATGGGAVLRSENVTELKKNGTIVYLDRPIDQILPTADRPLTSTREALEKKYQERKPIYEAAADLTIHMLEDRDENVHRILKAIDEYHKGEL